MKTNKAILTRTGKKGLLLIFLLMLCLKSNAQFDQKFTQYMNNEMFINPAYTGTREYTAITLAYRNQWVGFDGAPKTQTFSIHSPIKEGWGLGISALNEEIGITHQLKFNGSYAYQIKINRKDKLSFGILGSLVNLRENYTELLLRDQNDINFSANNTNVIAPNAGFGMYYYSRKYFVGLSIPRMIKNSIISDGSSVVKNSASPKNWHFYLTAGYVKGISNNFKIKPSFMIKEVYGAPVQVEISLQGIVKNFWWIGLSYHTGDAISAITGFHITPPLRVFYSYDYSITKLKSYSSGSHEITISYDISNRSKTITNPRFF
jgi:type IX secretion system PorP/SprF family membrane protein